MRTRSCYYITMVLMTIVMLFHPVKAFAGQYETIDYSGDALNYMITMKGNVNDCGVASMASIEAYVNKSKAVDYYAQVYQNNGNSVYCSWSKNGYSTATKNLSMEFLYEKLKNGPCVVNNGVHYSVLVGCRGTSGMLGASDFTVMEIGYWRMSTRLYSLSTWLSMNGGSGSLRQVCWRNNYPSLFVEGWDNSLGYYRYGLSNGQYAKSQFLDFGRDQKYYFDQNGRMITSDWILVDGLWYHAAADGHMDLGWQYYDGAWYYFNDPSGDMKTNGWETFEGKRYYLGEDGKRYHNTVQTIDGTAYRFDSEGAATKAPMKHSDGARIQNEYEDTKQAQSTSDKSAMQAVIGQETPN